MRKTSTIVLFFNILQLKLVILFYFSFSSSFFLLQRKATRQNMREEREAGIGHCAKTANDICIDWRRCKQKREMAGISGAQASGSRCWRGNSNNWRLGLRLQLKCNCDFS